MFSVYLSLPKNVEIIILTTLISSLCNFNKWSNDLFQVRSKVNQATCQECPWWERYGQIWGLSKDIQARSSTLFLILRLFVFMQVWLYLHQLSVVVKVQKGWKKDIFESSKKVCVKKVFSHLCLLSYQPNSFKYFYLDNIEEGIDILCTAQNSFRSTLKPILFKVKWSTVNHEYPFEPQFLFWNHKRYHTTSSIKMLQLY